MLRQGQTGHAVRTLQTLLRSYEPSLREDGVYGPRTERAVRMAQRKLSLHPPDGIAGPQTMTALKEKSASPAGVPHKPPAGAPSAAPAPRPVVPPPPPKPAPPAAGGDVGRLMQDVSAARSRAAQVHVDPGLAQPIASLQTSAEGIDFIFAHEHQKGVSNHLHFPGGNSGVTLGAGYDMSVRSAEKIKSDLMLVGVPEAAAAKAAEGSKRVGAADTATHKSAKSFVEANRQLLDLSETQQKTLLRQTIEPYEQLVKRSVRVPLHQYEFDALVSFAGNPGSRHAWQGACHAINDGKVNDALVFIYQQDHSGKANLPGLHRRRVLEAMVYLYGEYR